MPKDVAGNYLLEALLSSGSLRFMLVSFSEPPAEALQGLLKPKAARKRFAHAVNLLRLYETELKSSSYLFGDVNGAKGPGRSGDALKDP